VSTEDPEEPAKPPESRSAAPTVLHERREPASTVILPDPGDDPGDDEADWAQGIEPADVRIVASTGCALQVAAGFAFVGMVGWTLIAVVFGLRVAETSPGFGGALLVAEASLAIGCTVGAVQIVRHLRAVADAWRRRPIAVPRALAAHRDFVATAAVSAAITLGSLIVGTVWWLSAG